MYCYEQPDSRVTKGDPPTEATLHYVVHGTTDEESAIALLFTQAPETYRSLPMVREEIKTSPSDSGVWRFDVPYRSTGGGIGGDAGTTGGADETFGKLEVDISAETQHVTQCIEQSEFGPTAATDIRTARVVGLTRDGVDGVDLDATKAILVWHEEYDAELVDGARIERWMRARGKVNSAPYPLGTMLCDAGELRFLGATITSVGISNWKVTFRFEFSPNVGPIAISDDVNVPLKQGHQYLWVQYHKDVADNEFIEVPLRAWVSTMFESINFAAEIGVFV